MSSFVDVTVVRRHLESAGHNLSSEKVTDLLRDLGFSVRPTPPRAQFRPELDRSHAQNTHPPRNVPPKTISKGPVGGISALAAKLDELERQIQAVTTAQAKLQDTWKTLDENEDSVCSSRRGEIDPFSPEWRCQLGNEAKQLKDWSNGTWPSISKTTAMPSIRRERGVWVEVEKERKVAERQRCQPETPGLHHRMQQQRKTDPVARYQELQRIWARDPFLQSGGDSRVSRRKEEGFRDVYTAIHTYESSRSQAMTREQQMYCCSSRRF